MHWLTRQQVEREMTDIPINSGDDRITDLAADLDNIPMHNGQPVFAEPWHAQVFAMVLQMHEKGLFDWGEWSETLGEEIVRAQANGDPDLGDTYYNHWLNALERLLINKQLADNNELGDLQARWHAAALATPHGEPISIDPST